MIEITIKLNGEDGIRLKELMNSEESVENIINKIVHERINFVYMNGGFKYNIEEKKLFNKNRTQIILTKTEEDLLHYLVLMSIKNKDSYANLLLIKKEVWKNNEATVYSIRNKIMAIREKTCKELIKSKNNYGYRINIDYL